MNLWTSLSGLNTRRRGNFRFILVWFCHIPSQLFVEWQPEMAIEDGCGTEFLWMPLFWWLRSSWGGFPHLYLEHLPWLGANFSGPSLSMRSKPRVTHPQILALHGLWHLIYFSKGCGLLSSAFPPIGLFHSTWVGQLASQTGLACTLLEKWLIIFTCGWCPSAFSSSDSLFPYFYSFGHFSGNWRGAGC